MVTENQRSTIHIENLERQVHSILLKSSNHMGGAKKMRRKEQKQPETINKMTISTYLR